MAKLFWREIILEYLNLDSLVPKVSLSQNQSVLKLLYFRVYQFSYSRICINTQSCQTTVIKDETTPRNALPNIWLVLIMYSFKPFNYILVFSLVLSDLLKMPHTGNNRPSHMCVIKGYSYYTMSLSQFYGYCQYHESMSIP